MFTTLLSAFGFWLNLFEAVFGLAGLRGVTWSSDRLRGASGLVLPLLLCRLRRAGFSALVALALMLPLALLVQLGLSSLRRRHLNPLHRLRPGAYADRVITRLDIPTREGAVPALHVTPAAGTRRVVCVAHGSGCDKTFYAWRLVDALLAQGIAVLLIDLDGHGESPRPQAFPAMLHNISGTVDWLRARYEQVGLVGMSLGGCIAARAVAEGSAVDALVLLEAPTQLRLTKQQLDRIVIIETLHLLRLEMLHLLRDGSLYHVIRAWRTSGIRAEIGTWDLFDALDLLGSLERMRQGACPAPPLLLVYGGSDPIVVPSEAERVRQAMPAHATFQLLPGASHISLPIELRTLQLIVGWLRQQFEEGTKGQGVETGDRSQA